MTEKSKSINKKLFGGEWVFAENERIAYKLDKQGTLIFNCSEDVTEEEKREATIEALVHLGVDETKAEELASHMGDMQ